LSTGAEIGEGRYTLIAELGRGGMGVASVASARHFS
tara:strand:+ start:470 stop:577 length:108 start_codon:yes stop_codon:yes gene_type:complete